MTPEEYKAFVDAAHRPQTVSRSGRSKKRIDSGHPLRPTGCKKCLRYGRHRAIVVNGRGRAGHFKFPKSWPKVRCHNHVVQFCPDPCHEDLLYLQSLARKETLSQVAEW